MAQDIDMRARDLAVYILEHRATVRSAAKHFGISKSTVHKDVAERLRRCDRSLWVQVREVLLENKAQRHLRGGEATRQKYLQRRAARDP